MPQSLAPGWPPAEAHPDLPASLWPILHRLAAAESWPPSSPATADLLIGEASRQGLLPLLLARDGLPAVVQDRLARVQAWRALHARKTAILLEAVARLAGLLEGEPFVLLKGAEYMWRLYPSPELRPMHDVDILVPRARSRAVGARLQAAGLSPRFAEPVQRLAAHHEKQFVLGSLLVEVHHSFVQRPRHRIDYEAVWSRRVPLETPAVRAARLSDVDALVYHALSMAMDEFRVRLIRYVDLWRMLRSSPGLAAAAAERAREWSARHALYAAFRQLGRLFPDVSGGELESLGRGLLARPLREFVDRAVLPDPADLAGPARPPRPVQLWRKYWLMDNSARRLSFACWHGAAALAGRWVAWRQTAP